MPSIYRGYDLQTDCKLPTPFVHCLTSTMLPRIGFYSPFAIITKDEDEERRKTISAIIDKYKDRVAALPKHKSWIDQHLCKYEGFWYHQGFWYTTGANFSVEAVMAAQDNFQARPTDVFLASYPKSGTTWLKALTFAIMNRTRFKPSSSSSLTHPLSMTCPHDCVPYIESDIFLTNPSYASGLMATHMPYTSLPQSIITSGCRIVYICRNSKDVIISFWHFTNKVMEGMNSPIKLEDAFEFFSKGITAHGSFWDHVIGYRKASLERPDKVLFLNYEEMKRDAKNEVKKLANFIGYSFTQEEEADGEVEEIIKLCSFEKLSSVNKGKMDREEKPYYSVVEAFYRKGEVGDSVNYLTSEMIQILDTITAEKYAGLDIPT